MIHIVKEKKGFAVKSVADNGELLATSETLKTKQAAWKNVMATMKEWCGDHIHLQDDTLREPILYIFSRDGKKTSQYFKPKPRYITGKNPKNKQP